MVQGKKSQQLQALIKSGELILLETRISPSQVSSVGHKDFLMPLTSSQNESTQSDLG